MRYLCDNLISNKVPHFDLLILPRTSFEIRHLIVTSSFYLILIHLAGTPHNPSLPLCPSLTPTPLRSHGPGSGLRTRCGGGRD